ncbi:hypothetical protein ACQ0N2_004262 [Enterobacter bugandensis]
MSRPLPAPEIFPLFVTVVTLNPETETALSLPEDEMMTSLLMVYSASEENSCGTEVD